MSANLSQQTSKPELAVHQWHAMTIASVEQELASGSHGLSESEVIERLAFYGHNQLAAVKKKSALRRLLMQFHNILLYVMLAAAAITALLGHWVDTGVLLGAVIINVIIGFIQEGKAEAALDAIRGMLSPRAKVIREGKHQEIDAQHLVPGDIVELSSGDRVPADLRLITVHELRIEEAALTGESIPLAKHCQHVSPDTPLGDRLCIAYSGTVVVYGKARGIVVATGKATELGKINQMLAAIQRSATPLMQQIDHFGRILALTIIGVAAVTFAFGVLLRGQPPSDMFMMVVALAASAIPEGLPAIMTVTLALGVQRMARKNAIIRHLPAVETLGSVTVICSDKTGTLTRNEMTVQRVICANHAFDVGGVGYAPSGNFSIDGRIIDPRHYPALNKAILSSVLCNDAHLNYQDGAWQAAGNPTESALLVMAGKAGMDKDVTAAAWPRLGLIPFESQHRLMATHHQNSDGQDWIFLKGAPESIIERCDTELHHDGLRKIDKEYWHRTSTETASQGLRLLTIACRQAAPESEKLRFSDLEKGFTLLAIVGLIDPPREEALLAVKECHQAGINVKMITGDHLETARAIATQLGIGADRQALTGTQIEALDDTKLQQIVSETDIYARASPEHKLRLVVAMQNAGQVIAMTGDGVNDAPALKRADVGVAMGKNGTEAAKEASDMVLADDNFATIANAVKEGRAVYDNIKKFVLFMLPTNGGEALVVIAAILFELTLPLTPAQVLWINMATSSTLGLALAFEPAERGLMNRRPRPPGDALLSGFFVWRVVMVSILMMAGALGLFLWELQAGTELAAARTMAVNAVVFAEMFYLINSRYIFASVTNKHGLFGNAYALIAIGVCLLLQIAFTHSAAMHAVFGSADLTAAQWIKVVAAGVFVFMIAEFEKFVIRSSRLAERLYFRGTAAS